MSTSLAINAPLLRVRSLKFTPTFVLCLLAVFFLGFHAYLAATQLTGGMVDWGAYLLSRNHVLGLDPTNADRLRPLLGPGWLLVPFTTLWGDHLGLQIWTVFFSLTPIAPVYLLSKRLLAEFHNAAWYAVAIVAFTMVDLWLGDQYATGVLPWIGFSLITLALWGLMGLRDGWRWSATLTVMMALPLIAHSNQTSAGLALVYIPPFIVAFAFFSRSWAMFRRMAITSAIGGILALTALPWYREVMPGSPSLRFPGPLLGVGGPLSYDWFFAYVVLIVGGLALWRSLRAHNHAVAALSVIMLLMGMARLFFSFDEAIMNIFFRSKHLSAFIVYPLAGWLVWHEAFPRLDCIRNKHGKEIRIPRNACYVLGIMAWVGLLWGFAHDVHWQAMYSRMVSDDMRVAIKTLQRLPGDGKVATNSVSLGLYIAADTHRKVLWTTIEAPPPAWRTMHFDSLCLFGWSDCPDPVGLAKTTGVDYVLLETLWPFGRSNVWSAVNVGRIYRMPFNGYALTAKAPWLELLYSSGSTRLYRIVPKVGA